MISYIFSLANVQYSYTNSNEEEDYLCINAETLDEAHEKARKILRELDAKNIKQKKEIEK
jgi:hypothetical protein